MRFAAALCTWVAGAALACVVAYFGWRVFGPSATHLPIAGPANPAAALVAANLFDGTPATASDAAPRAVLGNDARLLGIVAEPENAVTRCFDSRLARSSWPRARRSRRGLRSRPCTPMP